MNAIVQLSIAQFSIIYLLLIVVIAVMKKTGVSQSKLLLVASIRMTVQLVLAGFVLTLIFKHPHPLFVILYLLSMVTFTVHRVLSKNKWLSGRFKQVVMGAIICTGLAIVVFFVATIIRVSIFNPQYVIPLSGMVFGNIMTGLNLGLKSFNDSLRAEKGRVETLLNIGVTPNKILLPFANNSLETALLPTMNNMIGMGIVSLPGMMTGQILSGVLPMTAILYQIAIMIAICTAVCLSVFIALYMGYRTLYNERNQIKL